MDKIDKIRQEIERLKKILEESTYYLDNSQQALGYSFALDDFSAFIDSLPDEPVDYAEELKKCKDNPLYFYDKYVKVKQEPAEWSEEDEKILKGIIGLIDHNQHYDVSNKDMLAWLKSLPERFNPQPNIEICPHSIKSKSYKEKELKEQI